MDTDYSEYVNEVLDWYIALPDTPNRFSRSDLASLNQSDELWESVKTRC